MSEYISYSDSYSAMHKDGYIVMFSVLPGGDAKKIARANRLKSLKTYGYALVFGFIGW